MELLHLEPTLDVIAEELEGIGLPCRRQGNHADTSR